MRRDRGRLRSVLLLFGGLTLLLFAAGFHLACSYPDGLEKVAIRLGFASRATSRVASPMADYEFSWLASPAAKKIAAALIGSAVCFLAAFGIGKYSSRREGPVAPGPARPLE